ncbi:DUF4049 domain-containing protein [Escherichia coli]
MIPLFHLIRSNTLKPTPVYANYFDNTTDFILARNVGSYMGRHSKVKTQQIH